MKRSHFTKVAWLWGLVVCAAASGQEGVIFDMETVRHKPTEVTLTVNKESQKLPAGTAELVEGKAGKAVKFSFIENARSGFMVAGAAGGPAWDEAAGFSFWVKGDGSRNWGGIEIIDKSNFALRYGYCFPIDSAEWTKVTVPWGDLTPELAAPLVDAKAGQAPSRFGNFWFGKWFYWRDYPAHSFAIDQVMLEKTIDVDRTDYTPAEAGLKRTLEKLRQKRPVTIVTMGDSLSDARHWANQKTLWSKLLAQQLQQTFGGEVKLINPAIGGTTLSQNLVLMPRWLKENPMPDLVTIWFGFNDWDNGVRAPRFKEYLNLAIDRIRRQTKGQADILLLTTCPAHTRWETMREMEQAVRDVAAARKTGLADVAAAFRKAGAPNDMLKQGYWAWDKVHLGAKGHEIVKDVVAEAIK